MQQRWKRTQVRAELVVLRLESLLTTSLTDKRRRSEQSEIEAQENVPPGLLDPPHPLLPAQTERKATGFSCQRGNKPLDLEKASRTRRKQTLGKVGLLTKSSQHKLNRSGNSSFPAVQFVDSVFMKSNTATGSFLLCGSHLSCAKQTALILVSEWVNRMGMQKPLCTWHYSYTLRNTPGLTEISHFFLPEELDSSLPQPTTELGRRDHILMSHQRSTTSANAAKLPTYAVSRITTSELTRNTV